MAALTLHSDYTELAVATTRDQMETMKASAALVTADVVIPGTGGYAKSGADPAYVSGVVIKGAVAGQSASVVPVRSGYQIVGYDLSGLSHGAAVYVTNGRLEDAAPGPTNDIIVARVEYHPTAPDNKCLRVL